MARLPGRCRGQPHHNQPNPHGDLKIHHLIWEPIVAHIMAVRYGLKRRRSYRSTSANLTARQLLGHTPVVGMPMLERTRLRCETRRQDRIAVSALIRQRESPATRSFHDPMILRGTKIQSIMRGSRRCGVTCAQRRRHSHGTMP